MMLAFLTVRMLDGFANTVANMGDRVPELVLRSGFAEVVHSYCLPTPTGAISLWLARKPNTQ